MVTYEKIVEAYARISPYIIETPLMRLRQLDEVVGCKVFVKAENMQTTNSFKIRGGLNKIIKRKDHLKNGVVATSSGSHAIAIAYSAGLFDIPVIAILRDTDPKIKQDILKDLGAEVILLPYYLRMQKAKEIVNNLNYSYIHPYEDEEIIAGHGTLGIEIDNQFHFDKIVLPMGGGGLAAGLSVAIKRCNPSCKVIGCEPMVISKFTNSLEKGSIQEAEPSTSIADALLPLRPGTIPFEYIKNNLNSVIPVTEENIIKAERILIEKGKIITEISSAIVIGSALQNKNQFNKTDNVCFILSGGNVDLNYICKTLDTYV